MFRVVMSHEMQDILFGSQKLQPLNHKLIFGLWCLIMQNAYLCGSGLMSAEFNISAQNKECIQ